MWNLYTITRDASTLKMYLNENPVPVAEDTSDLIPGYAGVTAFMIGSDPDGYAWNGKIDEFRLYDHALTPEEIKVLFDAGSVIITDPVGNIDPCSLNITEDPAGTPSDTYVITLTEAIPAGADFRVYLDPCDLWVDGLKQATVAPAKAGDPNTALDILFNSGNWDTPVTVTVTAFDDSVGESPVNLSLGHSLVQVSGVAVDPEADPNWAFPSFVNDTVSAAVEDDDLRIAVDVVPTTLSVSEQGPTSDTYTIVLKQPPTNPLTIEINSDSQVDHDSTSLIFNSGNWSAPQTVTVTAVDDAIGEPDPQTSVISHSVDPGDKTLTSLVSEDFEDLSLDGSLYGTATVSGGYLRTDHAADGFIADFNDVVTDFEAKLSFNFGGDTYLWNVAIFAYGSDGDANPNQYGGDPCTATPGAPAGVMCCISSSHDPHTSRRRSTILYRKSSQ